MPEYLAPGVYVEEIDTGSKPIEGVSTSTAGMVGVTERGPVGVPVLVTSYGEYERHFGGRLGSEFEDHRYLPSAVEGFFTNGGKRVFVVRVLDTAAASRASFDLHFADPASALHETRLLRAAGEGEGDAAAPSPLLILDQGTLVGGETIRIGDGSLAEYRTVDAAGFALDPTHVPLHLPLSRTQAATATVNHIDRVPDDFPSAAGATLSVDAEVEAGSDEIEVNGDPADIADLDNEINALGNAQHLEIGQGARAEYRFVTGVTIDPADNTRATVELESALALGHEATEVVTRLDVDPANAGIDVDDDVLSVTTSAGSSVVFVDDRNSNFDVPTQLILFHDAGGNPSEVRRMGVLGVLTLATSVIDPLPFGSTVEPIDLADDAVTAALTRDARAGDTAIAVDVRNGLSEGEVLRVGTGIEAEFVVIDGLPNRAPGGTDPGLIVCTHALGLDHASGDAVVQQTAPGVLTTRPSTALVFGADEGDTELVVSDGSSYAAGHVRLTSPAGQAYYAALDGASAPTVASLALTVPLADAHVAGSAVAEREPLFTAEALDAGGWGNRLRISVEEEIPGLVAMTFLQTVVNATHIRLASAAGVEAGTVLEFFDPATGEVVGNPVKVDGIDRADFTLTLAALGAQGPQQTLGLGVRSREFRLTVHLLRRPDPAQPSRNDTVIDTEVFRYLSMDSRHSRYVETVIGDVDGELRAWDQRPEGMSRYLRVRDFAATEADEHSIRLGPETLVDVLPSGRVRPARHPLTGGNDALGSITPLLYVGDDAVDPEDRTGIHSLRNIDQISIVAAPGRTGATVQEALINHCEVDRYRFAVLDGPPPPIDALADVLAHRQQYDTKYASIYHPWLLVPEPFPTRSDEIPNLPIPPSGHVIGVYARTDVERGVHKAPANEVVRGIRGLNRSLTKGEHDLLNPYPVNVNVIRDFRAASRGFRIWGARVITSDPDFKYVPVRRLLIFLEESIDEGLQCAVFEPNAEPLWARVRRSISDFLRVVWRNGALEGVTEEQAFFVRCDRTTMTQTDIDNGRLICLVGVAPVKPAEFVIIRIGLKTAEAES
jgi:phage tail sheath protein FI